MDIQNLSSTQKLIDDLASVDLLKTWSLIITLLGDFNRDANVSLSGKQVRTILQHIGIKAEATRVALHRLKKDGWIETTKNGREVYYHLSKLGIEATSAAYKDVYREGDKYPKGWALFLTVQNELNSEAKSNEIQLFKNVILMPFENQQNHHHNMELSFNHDKAPDWFEERLVQRDTLERMTRLTSLAQNFIEDSKRINSMDAVALRLLFLHHWRKMALRETTWAHIWLFKEGSIAQYQRQIIQILNKLSNVGDSSVKHI